MDLEQRENLFHEIQRLEGLLAYAVEHDESDEVERIRAKLIRLVESI